MSRYTNCAVNTSEIRRGSQETKVIWDLKNWRKDFDSLRKNASCPLQISLGNKPLQATLYFGQEDYEDRVYDDDNFSWRRSKHWLTLWIEIILPKPHTTVQSPVTLSLDVHEILDSDSDEVASEEIEIFSNASVTFNLGEDPKQLIIRELILLNSYSTSNPSGMHHPKPDNLRYGITICAHSVNDLTVNPNSQDPFTRASYNNYGCTLGSHLKELFETEKNFSDLKLETKDFMILNAHRFILAARSPVMKKMIEDEIGEKDFSGTIKIDADGKPMMAILYWMYSGRLYEKAGLVMEPLMETASKFGLVDLLILLDNEMISLCTPQNMFSMFQAAKKGGLLKAVEDIGAFIKENL